MDVVRSKRSGQLWRRISGVICLAVVIALVAYLADSWRSRLSENSLPVIQRHSAWTDTVHRGELVHSIRGIGVLTPQTVLWVPAVTEGRVARVHGKPGDRVSADTVIVSLANPELAYSVTMAEAELRAAEQKLEALRARLQADTLNMEAALVEVEAEYARAQIELEVSEKAGNAVSDVTLKLRRVTAESRGRVVGVQRRRLTTFRSTIDRQLASQRAEVDVARTKLALEQNKRQGLRVAAGMEGILEQVSIEVGQRILAGDVLARVIDPQDLKASLRVGESQGRYVAVGQQVEIDTHHGTVPGVVARIDPAVQNTNVLVDVVFEAALPAEARPDLSVVGTIEIERLDDVIQIARPVVLASSGLTTLFRVEASGVTATRTPVRFGRSSPSHIQVVEGLEAGDEVILSDMTRWDAHDRIALQE